MKILFALNDDRLDDSLEINIRDEYKLRSGYEFEFDKAINLKEVTSRLTNNSHYDILILNEELEETRPVRIDLLEEINIIANQIKILFIFNSEGKDRDFTKRLRNLNISYISSDDISLERLVNIIEGKENPQRPYEEIEKETQIIEKESILGKLRPNLSSLPNLPDLKGIDLGFKSINLNLNKIIPVTAKKDMENAGDKSSNITVGIGAVEGSSGVTHTSLGLAVYLKRAKYKVAIIEYNNRPQLSRLLANSDSQCEDYFTINNIDIYYQKAMKQRPDDFKEILSQAKDKRYNYIIIDLGQLKDSGHDGILKRNTSYDEMCKADYKILCLKGSAWTWQDINFYRSDDFAQVEPNISSWTLVINLTTDSFFKSIREEIKNITVLKNIRQSPIFSNPFSMDETSNNYFEDLTKHIIS